MHDEGPTKFQETVFEQLWHTLSLTLNQVETAEVYNGLAVMWRGDARHSWSDRE